MRVVLSLCGLLLALFWVTRMTEVQLTALSGSSPREGPTNTTKTSRDTDPASSVPGTTASQQRAAQITQALEQAAAQRADDAASR